MIWRILFQTRSSAQVFGEDAEQETAKFNEEDIDSILSRRAQRVVAPTHAAGGDGAAAAASTFSTATFVPDSAGPDIDYDDPLFWEKLMPKAKTAAPAAAGGGDDGGGKRNRRDVARLGFDAAGNGGHKTRVRQAGSDQEAESDASGSGYGSGGGGGARRAGIWTQADMKAVKRALISLGFGRSVPRGPSRTVLLHCARPTRSG